MSFTPQELFLVIKNGHRNFRLAKKNSEIVLTNINIKVIPEEITFLISSISIIKTNYSI